MLILIVYGLTKPEEEYNNFYTSLNELGERRRYLHSIWLVDTEEAPQQIKKVLEGYLEMISSLLQKSALTMQGAYLKGLGDGLINMVLTKKIVNSNMR